MSDKTVKREGRGVSNRISAEVANLGRDKPASERVFV